jgi:hypothetical protein
MHDCAAECELALQCGHALQRAWAGTASSSEALCFDLLCARHSIYDNRLNLRFGAYVGAVTLSVVWETNIMINSAQRTHSLVPAPPLHITAHAGPHTKHHHYTPTF